MCDQANDNDNNNNNNRKNRGVATSFQKGRHTSDDGTDQIVMSFSPHVVGYSLKKGSQKG